MRWVVLGAFLLGASAFGLYETQSTHDGEGYRVVRGRDGNGTATLLLEFPRGQGEDHAFLACQGVEKGVPFQGQLMKARIFLDPKPFFAFAVAMEKCLDSADAEHTVTTIYFKITRDGNTVLEHTFSPNPGCAPAAAAP